jgi:hypothetical protein
MAISAGNAIAHSSALLAYRFETGERVMDELLEKME